jgi:hypothetical protein
MNRFGLLVSSGILGASLLAMAPRSTLAGEWVSLFDGKTLSGWTKVEGRRGGSSWEVVDGAITGSGQASMLYSPKGDYKNFRFRAEIKINDRGNSGMYFRCPVADGDFGKGYEAQIDSTHSDPIRTGSIYGFLHIYNQLVPPDTWFTYEVQVVDKNWRGMVIPWIKVSVDGHVLFEFLDRTKAWKQGYFAFQQHDPGSRVQIRKIEVMELDESAK